MCSKQQMLLLSSLALRGKLPVGDASSLFPALKLSALVSIKQAPEIQYDGPYTFPRMDNVFTNSRSF